MTPLEKPSRKSVARSMLSQVSLRTCRPKLVMWSVFFVVATAAAPVLADVSAASKGPNYATGHRGKKHLETRHHHISSFPQTPPPGYYGNWGFAPGGDVWDRNYLWRRSLGFWDTNAPACPFRYC
jgi:hypothetical protein